MPTSPNHLPLSISAWTCCNDTFSRGELRRVFDGGVLKIERRQRSGVRGAVRSRIDTTDKSGVTDINESVKFVCAGSVSLSGSASASDVSVWHTLVNECREEGSRRRRPLKGQMGGESGGERIG